MDPSILKLLEEDEVQSMHSGADVEALSAVLNRDIGGDPAAIAPPSESDAGVSLQWSSSASKQIIGQWQSTTEVENDQQKEQKRQKQHLQFSKQHLSGGELIQPGSLSQSQDELVKEPEENTIQVSDAVEGPKQEAALHFENHQQQQHIAQQSNSQQMPSSKKSKVATPHSENQQQHILQQSNNQQMPASNQANTAMRRTKAASSIPFHMLIPILRPHLDKDLCSFRPYSLNLGIIK